MMPGPEQREWLLLAALTVAAAACSGDEGSGGDSGCLLVGGLSGAITEALRWDDRQGCGGGGSSAQERTAGLAWGIVNPINFQLRLTGIDEGRAAGGVAGTVRIRQGTAKSWRTPEGACLVDVTTFALVRQSSVGKSYRLAGTATCLQPATAEVAGTEGMVSIADFSFRSTTLY